MYTVTNIFKDNLMSDMTSYILGYTYADGCIAKNNALIYCSIDLELIEKIKTGLNFNGPIKTKYNKGFDRITKNYRLEICRKEICDLLKDLRVKERDFFPDFYINTPYIHSFVRGVFDGDGCISLGQGNKPTINMILAEEVIPRYTEYFNSIGIYTGIRNSITDNMKYIRTSSKTSARILKEKFYSTSTIHLNRKYNKFCQIDPISCKTNLNPEYAGNPLEL